MVVWQSVQWYLERGSNPKALIFYFWINEFIYQWIHLINEFIDFTDEFTDFAVQNKWIHLIVINEFI